MSLAQEPVHHFWGCWLSNSSIQLWQKVCRRGRLSEVFYFGYKPHIATFWFVNFERDRSRRASHRASTNLTIGLRTMSLFRGFTPQGKATSQNPSNPQHNQFPVRSIIIFLGFYQGVIPSTLYSMHDYVLPFSPFYILINSLIIWLIIL